ncbi:MAG: pyrroloquinoline-quinone synthase PqqC [Acidimicrobiales bacterium]
MTMTDAPSTPDFEAALRGRADRYWHNHPFHLAMHEGRLDSEQLKVWAANRFYYQCNLPAKDAAIIANCPEAAVRRVWLTRIIYQDGARDGEGGIENWLRLCTGLGLSRDEVIDHRHVRPGVRFAVDAYGAFARARPWIEAVASSLTELFSPDLMAARVAAFERHYDFVERGGLAYFDDRQPRAAEDAKYALALVLDRCRDSPSQERALAALDFKLDVLWSMLDAIHDPAGR